ncbi:hypothetical protein COP2_027068 [Malus domestica]
MVRHAHLTTTVHHLERITAAHWARCPCTITRPWPRLDYIVGPKTPDLTRMPASMMGFRPTYPDMYVVAFLVVGLIP